MTLLETISTKFDGDFQLDSLYSLIFVTNEIKHEAEVVRGIVMENIGTHELRSAYFSDINQAVKEYENIADFRIQDQVNPKAALRNFIYPLPNKLTMVGSNVNMWLKPLLQSLEEYCELFKGREVDVVDLGAFATPTKTLQIHTGSLLSKVLPPSKFNSKTGSLARLCASVDVARADFEEPIYAEARARMIAETVRKNFERYLEEPED